MVKKAVSLVVLVAFLVTISGCASLNGDVPFRYQPSLLSSSRTINKTAGVNLLNDQRPQGDVSYTKSIKDLSEKVTAKLIDDFDESRLFRGVHFSVEDGDNLVIDGTINRFMWKLYTTPIAYIPLLNIIIYFGVPCYTAYGVADIILNIKDKNSGRIIGTFQADSKVESSYTIYNMKAGEAGAELAEAFRNVAKELKEEIASSLR